jgi:hypothetical protein
MTQAPDHVIHVQLSVGREHDFEQNFAFQLELAGLIGINGIRFESDFNRIGRRSGIGQLGFGGSVR